jgi:hypothetical protein
VQRHRRRQEKPRPSGRPGLGRQRLDAAAKGGAEGEDFVTKPNSHLDWLVKEDTEKIC